MGALKHPLLGYRANRCIVCAGGETKKGVLVLRGVAVGIIAIRWWTDSLRGVRSGKVGEQGNEDQKGFSFLYARDSRSFRLPATMIK